MCLIKAVVVGFALKVAVGVARVDDSLPSVLEHSADLFPHADTRFGVCTSQMKLKPCNKMDDHLGTTNKIN